jgi:hypothetical protein
MSSKAKILKTITITKIAVMMIMKKRMKTKILAMLVKDA